MKKLIFYFFTLSMILLSSCSATKFTYLNDMKESESYFVKEKGELIVKNRDRLSIVVSCKEPDLANLFNIRGDFSSVNGVASSSHQTRGYKVDDQGSLDYPLIGRIDVAGKTLDEVSELIRNKIIEGGFIKDPFITTDILNFKYTVLGAATPQVYYSEDGSITIFEAIAKANDIRSIGRVKSVSVIREFNGFRKVTSLDLTTKDVFQSPCYYLQQNDIIYIKPKYRTSTIGDRAFSIAAMVTSIITSVTTMLFLLK